MTLLDQHEDKAYDQWMSKVDDICHFNLDQTLIKRHQDDGLLNVNFDPKVYNFMEMYKCQCITRFSFNYIILIIFYVLIIGICLSI